jgi:hypothetical protein
MTLSELQSPNLNVKSLMRLSFHQFQLKRSLSERRRELDGIRPASSHSTGFSRLTLRHSNPLRKASTEVSAGDGI